MPAAWQKWMPIYIQRLKSNPYVIAMHPAAVTGYLWLVMEQWQSDDCTLPNDVKKLKIISGLGMHWSDYADEILERFTSVDGDRLRNDFCYELWMEAQAKYEESQMGYESLREKRREAGKFGAEKKWGDRPSTGQVRSERLISAREKGRHTTEQWQRLLAFCGFTCLRCGVDGKIVKDHIVPIYQGGSDSIDNIQPLCQSCNSSKGAEVKDYRPDGWQNAWQMPGEVNKTPSECVAAPGLTDTYTETNTRTKKRLSGVSPVDERHHPFRLAIVEAWPDGEPPWNGREGSALSKLLAANPRLTLEGFKRLLKHRRDSEGVNLTARPYGWLEKVTDYGSGPLDRYGRPIQQAKAPVLQLRSVTLEEAMQR